MSTNAQLKLNESLNTIIIIFEQKKEIMKIKKSLAKEYILITSPHN